ncbi:MAG: carbon-nitrogen hydrolase family protein [Actinomycetota bacterium]
MRVAVCQMRSDGDVGRNLALAERLLHEAGEQGADLAALPEFLEYMGPASARAEVASPVPGAVTDRLAEVAQERSMWVLAGGVLEAAGARVHDTSVLLDPTGEVAATYRKIHLYDVELSDQPPIRESDSIAPGDELVTHRVGDVRLGLSICYDVRFPELYRGLMAQGAHVLSVPSQFQHTTGREHWHTLLRARAIENQCFVMAPGQWGPFGDPSDRRRSYGHSLVVDPWGRVVVEAPEEGDGVWLADLDLEAQRELRRSFPVLQHRRLGITC